MHCNKFIGITKPGVMILNYDFEWWGDLLDCVLVGSFDKTKTLELNFKKCLLKLSKDNLLLADNYKVVWLVCSLQPWLYRSVKIQKVNVLVWPILSMIGFVQHKLLKWLTKLLQPLLDMYSKYCIKDTFTFVNYNSKLSFFIWQLV